MTEQPKQQPKKTNKPRKKGVALHEVVTLPNGERDVFDGRVQAGTLPPKKKRQAKQQGVPKEQAKLGHIKGFQKPSVHSLSRLPGARNSDSQGAFYTDVPVVDAYEAATAYAHMFLDPMRAPPARIPEPSINMPTEVYRFPPTRLNLTVYNGTTAADGSAAFLLRGDSYQTICVPATVSALHVPTWTGGLTYSTYLPYTSSYKARNPVLGATVEVFTTGDNHSVNISWYATNPAAVATQLADGPGYLNVGCDPVKAMTWSGADSTMTSGSSATFVASRPYSFTNYTTWTAITTDRSTGGNMGWFVWIYGLRSTDRVTLTYTSCLEVISFSASAGPLNPDSVAVVETTAASCDLTNRVADAVANTNADASVTPPGKPTLGERIWQTVKPIYDYARQNDWVWKLGRRALQGVPLLRRIGGWFLVNTDEGPQLVQLHPLFLHPSDLRLRTHYARLDLPALVGPNSRSSSSAPEEVKTEDDFQRLDGPTPRLATPSRPLVVPTRAGLSAGRATQ